MQTPPPLPVHPEPPSAPPPPSRFAQTAATFSLVIPFVSMVIGVVVGPQLRSIHFGTMAFGVVQVLGIILGLVLGILALGASSRASGRGVFGKAVAGVCINGALLLLLLSLPVLYKVTGLARQAQEKRSLSLAQARQGFATRLTRRQSSSEPVPVPPPNLFRVVKYPSPGGEMSAYITPSPRDGRKHPALLWVFGGFGNGIDQNAWESGPPENDQSASAFRKAGMVMMYPSLRGGNDNPGSLEGFYGEVDDLLAAADYLARQEYVDPERIYLGGHSTGGTLVLLVAESTNRFRAVFSFGPVRNVVGYGAENLPFDIHDRQEAELRAPVLWLHAIRTPTFVFEGTEQPGNISELRGLQRATDNPFLHFCPVKGATHFSILAPVSALIAQKILSDGGSADLAFSDLELRNCLRQNAGSKHGYGE